jgi:hypothetical protein
MVANAYRIKTIRSQTPSIRPQHVQRSLRSPLLNTIPDEIPHQLRKSYLTAATAPPAPDPSLPLANRKRAPKPVFTNYATPKIHLKSRTEQRPRENSSPVHYRPLTREISNKRTMIMPKSKPGNNSIDSQHNITPHHTKRKRTSNLQTTSNRDRRLDLPDQAATRTRQIRRIRKKIQFKEETYTH